MDSTPGKLHKLFDQNFLEYTSYVIRERAIPAIEDGLKPVQRRILQTLLNMEDGRFHKVANVVITSYSIHYTKLYDSSKIQLERLIIGNLNWLPNFYFQTLI